MILILAHAAERDLGRAATDARQTLAQGCAAHAPGRMHIEPAAAQGESSGNSCRPGAARFDELLSLPMREPSIMEGKPRAQSRREPTPDPDRTSCA